MDVTICYAVRMISPILVYLAIGSNVGDASKHIQDALTLLEDIFHNLHASSLYKTKPWGDTDQENFLNAAVSGITVLSAQDVLSACQKIEDTLGRQKTRKWGPRVIDIDIIFYGTLAMQTHQLVIPHAHYTERDFVLVPLLELDPHLTDPVTKKPLVELLHTLTPKNRTILSYTKMYQGRIF
jgi:2-amino-4-hydroxy-6-hydroxymethyldihydropteridine diphosphokinase